MVKLFALEDDKSPLDKKDLLIDKVLDYTKKDKDPISLTSDLIKQRNELKNDIEKSLNLDTDEESSESGTSDSETDNDSGDTNTATDDSKASNEGSEASGDDSDESFQDVIDKNAPKEDKAEIKETKEEDEDISSAADNKDDLANLVGSNTKDLKKSESEATEKFSTPKVTLTNLFNPIRSSYNQYLTALESYSISPKISRLAIEEQPVVYIKDSVLESLQNLVKLATVYSQNNDKFITNISESIKKLNEEITIYNTYYTNKKISFNFKLINDKDILGNVSIPGNSDLQTNTKLLNSYIEDSNRLISLILTNDFNEIRSSFTNSKFTEEEGFLAYKDTLPGFNTINVSLTNYLNYIKTDLNQYSYYKIKKLKTEDIFNLPSIDITKDSQLESILKYLDKLLIANSLFIDNLKLINTNFNKLVDEVKVMIYDVENNKVTNLTELKIDDKIKDFIKFKLVIEMCYINVNLIIDYTVSVLSVFKETIELKK